jgi:TATA-binding protein-associated factor
VSTCCDALGCPAIEATLAAVLPALQATAPPSAQAGAALCLREAVRTLDTAVLPYAALLIAPLVACLSSHSPHIRALGAEAFGSLMPLLPLEPGTPNPREMSAALCARKAAERPFVDQLLGLSGAKPPPYSMPVKVEASLRPYQQQGVDWLAFLRRFGLHGILCDDMGLGKTLQALCVLSAAAHERRQQKGASAQGASALPSLVVCPPTLTGHWIAEAAKFCPGTLSTLEYAGNAAARQKLQAHIASAELVVMSYDSLRADIGQLASVRWDYVVLDEGHGIRNAKAKVSIAAKRLRSARRLILSGTPLQNHAVELWSLFDFLMPNYLGSQAHFQRTYARPIHAALGARAGDAAHLEGEAALARLHRQVLPFCLRRTKESVLSELPAKLMEDRTCELHPVQRALYAAFEASRAPDALAQAVGKAAAGTEGAAQGGGSGVAATGGGKGAATHVFAALQYLRRVCNHPLLALAPSHPSYAQYAAQAKGDGGLASLACAPKLQALQQLLHECGIGLPLGGGGGGGGDGEAALGSAGDVAAGASAVATHRALVFAQSGSFLDRVESDLLRAHMPSVSYLRLDGRVPAQQRFALATKFNSDPSVDLMLLTTKIGGLGLNLTAADVVIFLDHDWNPMADLQAMDRAHRIGQTKVVSVYRLITKGTLEDKIMNLQRFKLHVANSVVNQQNAALATMNTEELLDLFHYSPASAAGKAADGGPGGAAAVDRALTGEDAVGAAEAAASLLSGGGGAAGRKRGREGAASAGGGGSGGGGSGGGGLKGLIDNVGELWESSEQYEEQFDLERFLSTLRS